MALSPDQPNFADAVVEIAERTPEARNAGRRLTEYQRSTLKNSRIFAADRAAQQSPSWLRDSLFGLAIAETLGQLDEGLPPLARESWQSGWRHCIAVGTCAELLFGSTETLSAFSCGLIHDVGKLAMIALLPKAYCRITARNREGLGDSCDFEQEILGMDHTQVGARVSALWKLPRQHLECAAYHHQEDDVLSKVAEHPRMVRLVRLANALVRIHYEGAPSKGSAGRIEHWSSTLGLKIEDLETARQKLSQHVAERVAFIGIEERLGSRVFSSRREFRTLDYTPSGPSAHIPLEKAIGTTSMQEALLDVCRRNREAAFVTAQGQFTSRLAEVAAGAAHELNTPLAVISGRAQLLQSTVPDPEAVRALRIIMEQAHRASSIVLELMQFAKPDPPRPGERRIAEALGEAIRRQRERAALAADAIELRVADERVTVFADPMQLDAVLDALLSNAVAACSSGAVAVQVNSVSRASDEMSRVVIEDGGSGMSLFVLEHAADPFFSHRPAGRGRGLGLSRAVRWIDANRGRIRMESTPGIGTRVTIELPARSPNSSKEVLCPPGNPRSSW